jgi:hypothetical protein
VIEHHLVHHLPDRESLALSPLRVAGLKPVEAAIRVIGVLLLKGAGIGSETVRLPQAARCLVEVGRSQTDLGGGSHERLPLLPVV